MTKSELIDMIMLASLGAVANKNGDYETANMALSKLKEKMLSYETEVPEVLIDRLRNTIKLLEETQKVVSDRQAKKESFKFN